MGGKSSGRSLTSMLWTKLYCTVVPGVPLGEAISCAIIIFSEDAQGTVVQCEFYIN